MQAVGIWAAVLEYTAEHAPNGDLTDHMDAVAAFCDWPDHQTLTDALVEVRHIDRSEDGRLIVHGWSEHAEESVHTRLACTGQWFADGTRPSLRRLNAEQRNRADQRLGSSPPLQELHNVAQHLQRPLQKAHVPSPPPPPSPSPSPMPTDTAQAAPAPFAPTRTASQPVRSRRRSTIQWDAEHGWTGIAPETIASWGSAYPACDIDRQLAAMSAWLTANPAKARKSNWARFITNWLSRQQDRGGDSRGLNGSARPNHRPAQPMSRAIFEEISEQLEGS